MKICPKCHIEKEDTEFTKAFGCKSCQKEYHKKHYEKDKEKILLQQKDYRKTPKGKEVQRIATAKYQKTPAGKLCQKLANERYKHKYEQLLELGELIVSLRI